MRPHKINKTTVFIITLLACCLSHGDDHTDEHIDDNSDVLTTSEVIMIPLMEKDMAANVLMPVRGDRQHTVQEEFGPPFNMQPAKGKPPISRWDYDAFSVYFESGIVIHSVLRREPLN